MSLGVHFAIDETMTGRLRAADGDDERVAELIEEIVPGRTGGGAPHTRPGRGRPGSPGRRLAGERSSPWRPL
ncbi:hypothetical protein [Winogradskya humida]|uniref:hypothetical protein n=1 Tax=Winogradskya humida TaxID=113566 RepID=UPI0019454DC5|nr:hypothetical protein [Actinoplanes humidus]